MPNKNKISTEQSAKPVRNLMILHGFSAFSESILILVSAAVQPRSAVCDLGA